ncbi:SDR family NAD(P)-dependent oxidoreductase [Mucilaginibacter robiniae]|uniref:SDR family NAD(P)-dependent oxidoreductase n=1 Tax=Mucilaginibacter robiniae TaxID=2728022 RepID=A0A7L5E1C3_9SPHI|nr:NAD-dependent epimerase/dehydratase family protein [Mucilaginibacter robiniae]QJD96831.1 SDR family NAD(P)-dependent oxidoreductase [Mucilaginibacter robiniae]
MKNILITGGAGFIGSHLCDELISQGYSVRVLDNLLAQVHGADATRPEYLNPEAELVVGDVRDKNIVLQALEGIDAVYHFAARVGVGQSMYEVNEYTDVNNRGTAVLLEALIQKPVKRLVVASSMSIYGEGVYTTEAGDVVEDATRPLEQLKSAHWELQTADGVALNPIPTPETKKPSLASVYALSKYDQEVMSLICGKAYNIPTVALRFFNVYGTRQALSNPYTGVLAIFASRYLNNKAPIIFEDGEQKRDFVHVKDVAKACRLALEVEEAAYEVFNIGSGNSYTVSEIARKLSSTMGVQHIQPVATGEYRVGDIRHCFGDISKAKRILGFEPEVQMEDGLQELAVWLEEQVAVDNVEQAKEELAARGLTV